MALKDLFIDAMRIRSKFAALLLIALTPFAWGESAPKRLVPKNPSPLEVKELEPKNLSAEVLEGYEMVTNPLQEVSFSVLMVTPLFSENFFEKRFQSIGDLFLFSIPVTRLGRKSYLHLQTGPGFTFAKLTLTQPPNSFSHLYIVLPIHLRFIYSFSKKFHVEAWAGGMLRLVEHDSRNTTDGGTRFVKDSNFISPDGAFGLAYSFTPALKARIYGSYLFFGGGVELIL